MAAFEHAKKGGVPPPALASVPALGPVSGSHVLVFGFTGSGRDKQSTTLCLPFLDSRLSHLASPRPLRNQTAQAARAPAAP
ncbi:hypothetical protein AAFF_G00183310 [Aldrovandia affinis]|uniref:Uncharacterized protein n=1 Tax=Aldrovandia affinis TaxID=143900 RepID=A0AAD7RMT9_9TELE|nr:hypothetical protein AAFF_G00183310 [Aldrovandia affinis]